MDILGYILPGIIAGIFSIIGVVLSQKSTTDKVIAKIERNQAVTDVKIDQLATEVREHNNFAQKIPTIQNQLQNLETRVHSVEVDNKQLWNNVNSLDRDVTKLKATSHDQQ